MTSARYPALERGGASVESVGLALLIALAMLAAVAAIVVGPLEGGRELASTLGRKIRCATQLPGPCWRDPLTLAYGRPVAGLVRALAPTPTPRSGVSGAAVLPVDFRYCRRESCALPGPREGITASNRRVTAFVSVLDERRSRDRVRVTYWLYRPGLAWERVARLASSADVDRHADTPLLEDANPRLVPLETLAGRNHYDFPPAEEPPWRWRVDSVYPQR
jgi:hypothetical protein